MIVFTTSSWRTAVLEHTLGIPILYQVYDSVHYWFLKNISTRTYTRNINIVSSV